MLPVDSVLELLHKHYDLVVIGFGPAGAGALSHPAADGLKVLVINGGKAAAEQDHDGDILHHASLEAARYSKNNEEFILLISSSDGRAACEVTADRIMFAAA